MSEDIVERLSGVYVYPAVAPHSEAISEAITEIAALRAKLDVAVKALEGITEFDALPWQAKRPDVFVKLMAGARADLAAIKGGE